MKCAKCEKELAKVAGHWIHKTHEDFQDCGFAKPANMNAKDLGIEQNVKFRKIPAKDARN